MADLSTVNKTLQAQNREQQTTSKELNELNAKFDQFIRIAQGDRMDALEERRKAKAKDNSAGKALGKAEKDPMMFPGLMGLNGLLASIAALGLAFAGLRGWEVRAIQNIGNIIPDFIKTFNNGVTKLVNNTLERLGFKAVMDRDAQGRFTRQQGVSPLERIRRAINAQYTKILDGVVDTIKAFKPGALISDDAAKALGRIKEVSKIALAPIIFLLDDIGKVVASIGNMIGKESADIVKKLVGNAGKFAGLVGKVLKPIGFIFSFAEGITEAFKTEGDIYDKLTAGVSRFVADFIGAPLDLLKDISGWLLKKMGFEEVAKSLENFSIEEALFGFINGAFTFIKKIFTGDFAGAGDMIGSLVDGILGFFKRIFQSLGQKLGLPVDLRTDQEKQRDALQDQIKETERRVALEQEKIARARKFIENSEEKLAKGEGSRGLSEGVIKTQSANIAKSNAIINKLAMQQTQLAMQIGELSKGSMTPSGGTTVVTDARQIDQSTTTTSAMVLPSGSVTDKGDYAFGGNTEI